jgi:hypothetical protein
VTTLGAWLKTQGFTVDDTSVPLGRQTTWHGVKFLMVHHTASPDSGSEYGIAKYVRSGGSYPPLSQIMLGQSGTVWMTCQERGMQKDPGRASHAGNGSGYGVARDSMNEYALGIECQCDGTHKLSTHDKLYSTLIDLLAALSRRYKVPVKNIIGHKEWSNTGKVDPQDSMDVIRADVADKLREGAVSDNYDYKYLGKPSGVLTVGREYKTLDQSSWTPPRSGWENTYVYLNIKPKFKSGATVGAIRVRVYREDGDTTGHHDLLIHKDALDSDGRTLRHWAYWEAGEKGADTKVQLLCLGGLESVEISTRYSKKCVVVD